MVAVKVRFAKMHGADNDFVMIDDREARLPLTRELVARIANRPDGIGCEGVIVVRKSDSADFAMRFFNPDGSEAELCGNGARCVSAFARAIGAAKAASMRFETLAGVIDAQVLDDGRVTVTMPEPKDLRTDFVNSGVPHKIVPVDDLAAVDVASEGRRIRYSDEFAPDGTNVDFVRFRSPHALDIRTYERGVEGETGACGTGSVAAAVVGVMQHGLEFPVDVHTQGGHVLTVDCRKSGAGMSRITLTGPVKWTFSGEIEIETLSDREK